MKGLVGLSKCEWKTYWRLLRVEKVSPPGFEPATYKFRSRHANHSATASHNVIRLTSPTITKINSKGILYDWKWEHIWTKLFCWVGSLGSPVQPIVHVFDRRDSAIFLVEFSCVCRWYRLSHVWEVIYLSYRQGVPVKFLRVLCSCCCSFACLPSLYMESYNTGWPLSARHHHSAARRVSVLAAMLCFS